MHENLKFVVLLFALLLASTAANAGGVVVGPPPVTCRNQTISNGETINTNLIVSPNTSCTLNNVTVTGNVDVEQGASLTITPIRGQNVVINGNLDANGCNFVVIAPTTNDLNVSIGGNLSIKNCTNHGEVVGVTISGNLVASNNTSAYDVEFNIVHGNMMVDNNSGSTTVISVFGNEISGNLGFSDNTALSNDVGGNTVGGNLSCKGNSPPPLLQFDGSGNTVTGNTTGQCVPNG
jgi:hypothetical protein